MNPYYGNSLATQGLPQAPRVAPPMPGPHGGMYGGGYGGVTPYQQNPYAETIGAIGNLMQGFGAMKQAQKKNAQDEFFQNLQLISSGLIPNPDYNHMAKLAKKAGLPFDFNSAGVTPNLGNGQQPQQQAAQPQMAQGQPQAAAFGQPQGGPPGSVDMSGLIPGGPQLNMNPSAWQPPDPQNLPMRQMNPMAMQGQYNLQPHQGFLGKIGNAMGLGSAPIAPNAPVVQQLQKFGQNAANMRQQQQEMQGMEMQSKISDFQQKKRASDMLLAFTTGKDQNGNPIGERQMMQLDSMLTQMGIKKALDLKDLRYMQVEYPNAFDDAAKSKMVRMMWDPYKRAEFISKRAEAYQNAGLNAEQAMANANAVADDKPPPYVPKYTAEQLKQRNESRKFIAENYIISPKDAKSPLVQEAIENWGVDQLAMAGIKSKTQLAAEKQASDANRDNAKFEWQKINDQRQINLGWANNSVARGNLDLRNREFQQGVQDKQSSFAAGRVMNMAQIDQAVKNGAMSQEQATEYKKVLMSGIRGAALGTQEIDTWGPFNETRPMFKAPDLNQEEQQKVLNRIGGTPAVGTTLPAQPQATTPENRSIKLWAGGPSILSKNPEPAAPPTAAPFQQMGVMGIVPPFQVQEYANYKGIPYDQAVQELQSRGLMVPGRFSQGAIPAQRPYSFGNINHR